jgi:hypothetical protein
MTSQHYLLVLVAFTVYLQHSECSVPNEVGEITSSSKRDVTQCAQNFLNYPLSCNRTLLLENSGISFLNGTSPVLNDEQLDSLNVAYSRSCTVDCVNPIIAFNLCFAEDANNDIINELYDYLNNLTLRGICGKEGNDFCKVHYLRIYRQNVTFFNTLFTECQNIFSQSGFTCSGRFADFLKPSNTCLSLLSEFITNMGCCARPILGDGITTCQGINATVQPACVSQATGIPTSTIAIIIVVIVIIALILCVVAITVTVVLIALKNRKSHRGGFKHTEFIN